MSEIHPYLLDPRNAAAYQTLCDCPRGTVPAWATKAGWTYAQMRHFIKRLGELGLASITRVGNVQVFQALRSTATECEGVRSTVTPYLDKKLEPLDKVPRYGGAPVEKKSSPQSPDAERLIAAFNNALSAKFDGWEKKSLDNIGSNAAAKKILAVVPVDRAEQLVDEACWAFTPDKTGGDLPRSLGHPFLVKYAINEWRRIQRELERGQLSMLFVERSAPPPPPEPPEGVPDPAENDRPPSSPEFVREVIEDMKRVANGEKSRLLRLEG